jgi:hypothetical protein
MTISFKNNSRWQNECIANEGNISFLSFLGACNDIVKEIENTSNEFQ